MNSFARKSLRPLARTLTAAALWLTASGIAHADANAFTDDKSVDVPTAAYVYVGQTVTQISNLLTANQARLTDIEVSDAANGLFTVTMVRNAGVYAAGWFWYVGQTFAQVNSLVSANNGRLIDIEPYDTASGIRYAVIMVSNTGSTARGWTYLSGVSATQVNSHISSTGNRLIQLQPYDEGGVTKYAIITVANTGADAKAWQYFYNQTAAQVGTRLSSFGGRLTSLERRSNGNYDIVLVQNSGADGHYFLYYTGLTSTSTIVNVANQFGSRVFDIGTYLVSGQRRYDVMLIDNSNTENRRIRAAFGGSLNASNGLPNGQWGAYLRPVGSTTPSIDLNGERRFEPASAIKAVHNLAVMQRVMNGTASLGDSITYYNYGQATQKDACPDPARENGNFDATTTLDNARNLMMGESNNTMTRAITLLFGTGSTPAERGPTGITALETIAVNTIGMADTFMNQQYIGCGYQNGFGGANQFQRNQTTLADLGKLYEGVQNGQLLGTGTFRDQFYQPMNGGAFDLATGTEADVRAVVQEEATALGKSAAVVTEFINNMEWRYKPGGYGLGCGSGQYYTCTDGFISISTIAGRLTLPSKKKPGKPIKPVQYVFGRYTADRNVCIPGTASGTFGSCADAPVGFPTTTTETNVRTVVNKELFRSIIRQNLANF